ncbi:MAG: DUF296 domain-containing protein [Patescibacteria group bacterium]|nr:DUF296 domain-containing protein [Patescibacteria group bacterium]
MQSKEKGNLIVCRLFSGEDVFAALQEVCEKHGVKAAVIVSAAGQIAEFELGFFKEKGDYLPEKFAEPAELLSLNGLVSQQEGKWEFHLHGVFSRPDKSVTGGHFIAGKVSITAEIVLMKTGIAIQRKTEETTGLRGLFVNK